MSLLLEEHEDPTYSALELTADFIQLTIVFALVYLGLYYIPSLQLDSHNALQREIQMELGENGALVLLALFQRARTTSKQTRSLFGVWRSI
jgi:hypothetical protein